MRTPAQVSRLIEFVVFLAVFIDFAIDSYRGFADPDPSFARQMSWDFAAGAVFGALATLGSYFGLRWSQWRLNYWIGMLIAIAYLGATACLGFARTSVSIDPFSLVALGFAWGCALPYLISLLAVRVIPSINRDSA